MQSLWMLLASFLFAVIGVCVKFAAAAGYSTAELVFYRSAFGLAFISAVMLVRRQSPATPHLSAHLQRGVAGTFAIWLFMHSVVHLPLSTAITLNFTAPLWIGLILALVFGERLSKVMVLALAAGFTGIVILLKPIFTPDRQFDLTIALLSGVTAAIGLLNVRRLGGIGEPEWRIFFYFTLVVGIASATWLTVSSGWRRHDSAGLAWLIGMGIASTAGQLAQTRAYAAGKTMLAANLSYAAVLFSALAGMLVYGETVPPGGWLGMAIIIGAGIMATLRTARAGKRTIEPEPPSPGT